MRSRRSRAGDPAGRTLRRKVRGFQRSPCRFLRALLSIRLPQARTTQTPAGGERRRGGAGRTMSLQEVATLDRRDVADFAPVSLESVARGCRAATRPFGIRAFDQPERTRGVCARRGCFPDGKTSVQVGQVRSGKPPEQDGRGQTRIVPPSMTATVPVAWSWSISCRLFSGYQVAGADYQRMRMRPGARRT